MAIYLSVDAGGSKCCAILYDDTFRLIGRGLSGGVNTTQASLADVEQNVRDCLSQVFSSGVPEEIDRLYASFVGPVEVLLNSLRSMTRLGEVFLMPEPVAGLYAGALRTEGILALSGTGSDIFYITAHPDRSFRQTVGGWGPILGDKGSGTWLGQQALRASVMALEGWGEKTVLVDMLRMEWALRNDFDMVAIVHQNPAPFRKVASVTRLLGKAAQLGDQVAASILREGGALLARQTICLLERVRPPEEHRVVTCCGGAWKTHPLLFLSFRERLLEYDGSLGVEKPWFEHVLAGPARLLLERGMAPEEGKKVLTGAFPDDVIQW